VPAAQSDREPRASPRNAKREFRQQIEAYRIEADALIYLMQLRMQKRKMSKKRFQTPTATS
jgi:hypothetical protein